VDYKQAIHSVLVGSLVAYFFFQDFNRAAKIDQKHLNRRRIFAKNHRAIEKTNIIAAVRNLPNAELSVCSDCSNPKTQWSLPEHHCRLKLADRGRK